MAGVSGGVGHTAGFAGNVGPPRGGAPPYSGIYTFNIVALAYSGHIHGGGPGIAPVWAATRQMAERRSAGCFGPRLR